MTIYNLAGRTVAITGSTGGLGSALAEALRARGANLALLDLDRDSVEKQAGRLGSVGVARGWAVDVRDLSTLDHAMGAAADHFGRIDVVIANAGITPPAAPLWDLKGEDFERTIDINLNGVWRTFRAGVPHVEKTRGYLLAISSMAAFVHGPLNGPYCATKAGVWALADSTRLELRDAASTLAPPIQRSSPPRWWSTCTPIPPAVRCGAATNEAFGSWFPSRSSSMPSSSASKSDPI